MFKRGDRVKYKPVELLTDEVMCLHFQNSSSLNGIDLSLDQDMYIEKADNSAGTVIDVEIRSHVPTYLSVKFDNGTSVHGMLVERFMYENAVDDSDVVYDLTGIENLL